MTDLERLIELLDNAPADPAGNRNVRTLAEHLISHNVITLPCRVGDPVFPLNADRRFRAFIERIIISANGMEFEWAQYDVGPDCTECWDDALFTTEDIGKTVFLDEIEYLKALAEREKNDNPIQ